MKKLLLSIVLLSTFSGFAQILSEGFEATTFPPTGWTSSSTVATRPWGLTTTIFNAAGQATFNITGARSAGIGWISGNNVADLTSPAFSLMGYSAATLTFNIKIGYEYMVAPDANGNLEAQISTNGTTWTTLWVEEDQGLFVDYETLAISLNLTAYLNQSNVKIRFLYTADDADSLSIDDVVVSGTLGTQDLISSKFTTYPNPTSNFITISNNENINLNSITITDINGRTVKQINLENVNEAQINVADLSSGVYFMNVSTHTGTTVKKFIKK